MPDNDYNWDLDLPSNESAWDEPLYNQELRELEQALNSPYTGSNDRYDAQDLEEIELWEDRLDLAAKQMVLALGKQEENPSLAENAYETGLLMIHDALNEFDPEYIQHPLKPIDTEVVETLRFAYQHAYNELKKDRGTGFHNHDLGGDLQGNDLGSDLDNDSLDGNSL